MVKDEQKTAGAADIVVAETFLPPSPKKAPTDLRTHGLTRYCRRSNHSVTGAVDIVIGENLSPVRVGVELKVRHSNELRCYTLREVRIGRLDTRTS